MAGGGGPDGNGQGPETASPAGASGGRAGAAATGTGPADLDAGRGPLDPDGRLHEIALDCVHCGFCLPVCPTYQLWGEEMDSPRGRIHLISQLLDGAQASEQAATHIDRCLGCMACVPACPSGVRYDRLIEAARSWTEEPGGPAAAPLPPRSARDRAIRTAIFQTFPYPRRLRLLLGPLRAAQRTGMDRLLDRSGLVDRLSPELAAALRVAPTRPARPASQNRPARDSSPAGPGSPAGATSLAGTVRTSLARTLSRPRPRPRRGAPGAAPRGPVTRVPAQGPRRAVVGMLTGCVQQVFFPSVNAATVAVLAAEGCDVIIPREQGCCGALSLHGGRLTEARKFARQTIATFERAGVDAVVVNAAGCGSAMKEYAELLASDPDWGPRAARLSDRVRDFSEFLAELGPAAPRHPLPVTVAYHDACHLGHAQRITAAPRALLAAIPELRLAEIGAGATCCGSAGIYNLVQPEAARELGDRKAGHVLATEADLLVSANPGCSLQITSALAARGASLPTAHLAEVLHASIAGRPLTALGG